MLHYFCSKHQNKVLNFRLTFSTSQKQSHSVCRVILDYESSLIHISHEQKGTGLFIIMLVGTKGKLTHHILPLTSVVTRILDQAVRDECLKHGK